MITWTAAKTKMQRQTRDSNPDTLLQLSEDWNTGYHMFNAKLARYYSRKQQFTNLVGLQSIYQTPIDCVRVIGITVYVTGSNSIPLTLIKDEDQWRRMLSNPQNSNWPSHFYVLGNDSVQLWPTPSQAVANGLRFYYQPQDHDLGIDDVTSVTSGFTVSANNASNLITASGTAFNSDMASLSFQLQGVTDVSWYPITSATTSVLTLQAPFVGTSGSNLAWRVGQCSIIPQEYDDAPMHYALGNYWTAQGNVQRAAFHLGSDENGKRGMFYSMIKDCLESYSSSSTSSVTNSDDTMLNLWQYPPNPSVSV